MQSTADAENGNTSLHSVMIQMDSITESENQSDKLIQSLGESSNNVREILDLYLKLQHKRTYSL